MGHLPSLADMLNEINIGGEMQDARCDLKQYALHVMEKNRKKSEMSILPSMVKYI